MASTEGQQHPLGIYFQIWILLFVLSGASYGRLLGVSRLLALVPDHCIYDAQSRTDCVGIYAHDVGTSGAGLRNHCAAVVAARLCGNRHPRR